MNKIEKRKLKKALKSILEGSIEVPPFDPKPTEFFGDLHLDKPENAYYYGFQTALLDCGEIIAKVLK